MHKCNTAYILDGNSQQVFNRLGCVLEHDDELSNRIIMTRESSRWVLDALNDKVKYKYYPISSDGLFSMLSNYSPRSFNSSLIIKPSNYVSELTEGFLNIMYSMKIPIIFLEQNKCSVFNRLTYPSDVVHSLLNTWIKPSIKIIVITATFEQEISKSMHSTFIVDLIYLLTAIEGIRIILLNDSSQIGTFKTANVLREFGFKPTMIRPANVSSSVSENILLIGQLLEHCSAVITQKNIVYEIARLLKKKIVVLNRSIENSRTINKCEETDCDLSIPCEYDLPCIANFDCRIVYKKLKELLCLTGNDS